MNKRNLIAAALVCLLGGTALPPQARQSSKTNVPALLIQQLIADVNDNKNRVRLSKADLTVLRRNLKHELHDLNADGTPEFFLFIEHDDWCGAGSNCSYWVYRRTKKGYSLLIVDKVLRVEETITNGFRDLASETPMGFCEPRVQRLSVTPYKYDGEKYQAQRNENQCRTVRLK